MEALKIIKKHPGKKKVYVTFLETNPKEADEYLIYIFNNYRID